MGDGNQNFMHPVIIIRDVSAEDIGMGLFWKEEINTLLKSFLIDP